MTRVEGREADGRRQTNLPRLVGSTEPKIRSILFPIRTLSLSFSLMPPSPHAHPLNCLASSPSSRLRASGSLCIISRGLAYQSHSLVALETAADSRVSTVRSAIELKQVFDKLQQAESAGLSAEQMRKLEEQAAEQGMRTLWKVCLITSTTLHHIALRVTPFHAHL